MTDKVFKADFCLYCLCICAVLTNCCYALCAPFLPLELVRLEVSVDLFGYIFGLYSVAICIGSPVVGFVLSKYKKRRLVV